MTKTTTSMTLDQDISKEFQQMFPGERSSFCNEQMRLRIASAKGDLSGVDLNILFIEEKELKEKADLINNQLFVVTEKISKIKEKVAQDEKTKLIEEQERLEQQATCPGCGNIILPSQKQIAVGDHKFCHNCFMTNNSKFKEAVRDNK